jgi:MFS family permease
VQAGLVLFLVLLYLPLQNVPYYAHELRRHFGHDDAAFYPYYFAAFGSLLAALALPIGFSGAVLPLLFHVVRRQVGDLGAVAGRLYSWNTLGSVAGALLGGYALLFWLDLHHIYRLAIASLALAAAILASRLLTRRQALVAQAALAAVVIVMCLLPRWSPIRLSSGPFRNRAAPGPSGQGPKASSRLTTRSSWCRSTTTTPRPRWRCGRASSVGPCWAAPSSTTASPTATSQAITAR